MRHKIIGPRWKLMIIISNIFLTLNTMVFGVPLSISYSNQENIKHDFFTLQKIQDDKKLINSSCIVNNSQYKEDEHVPGAGPCEECICHPPNVVCSMMKCPTNSGCITIQLPNKCCPKYKCDCEHKGKLYYNGEKIITSDESACRVCFCNGGEIVCTSIVCYTRNDCQGYYLPGDCCPKYDNCSSISIEQKSREQIDSEMSNRKNIYYWSQSTKQNDNEDNIWKRDTEKSEIQNIPTIPNIITSILFEPELNPSLQNNLFEESEALTLNSITEKNINFNELDNETITQNNTVTDITIGNASLVEDSINSFLGFETDNLTTDNEDIIDTSSSTNDEIIEITPQITELGKFEELFDETTDIDNSVVITHQNGTETITVITEAPSIDKLVNSSTEISSTQVEVFNPRELLLDVKRPMVEYSTITSELDTTTEMDYEGSREATTPRAPDKSTIGVPHKLVMDKLQTSTEEEINTEIIFTDLEDTTDMFGPNFGHQSYKRPIPINSNPVGPEIKKMSYPESYLKTILTNRDNTSNKITESPEIEFFNRSLPNQYMNENDTLMDEKDNPGNISTYKPTDTNILELETINITSCVNNSCTNYSKLYDELLDSQTESTTPFVIETKVLPNQELPHLVNKKMPYPKEYPEEFDTIQNGPSLTITKRTYTSIPDVVYTTTTMITLPTLDLIYKANKDIEKYLTENQSTTIKPSNSLSPLRNVSFLNSN